MRAPAWVVILATLVAAAGCGPTVDLSKGLQITVVRTGWYDAGIVDGKNKLVPQITIQLKNLSDQTLGSLQVNAEFRRVTEQDEWDAELIIAAGSEGLKPGATTKPLTITSKLGYTGTEPRQQMLQNKLFVDAKVELLAKYGSIQWKRIGEYPITRQLLTQ
ncbi:MAG: hypothetical protein ACM3SQ_17480 [Betaproteobacteria bacterium]